LINARFIKPLDHTMLKRIIKRVKTIVTIEENACHGGFGSAVFEYCCEHNMRVRVRCLGLPDNFIEHGARSMLLKITKMDAEGLAKRIISVL
jgi:1-deoxy-D-xylulose-5-phosphate synthase